MVHETCEIAFLVARASYDAGHECLSCFGRFLKSLFFLQERFVLQVMSASHVSGGFWLQVPAELCVHFETAKHDITLLCDEHPPQAVHNKEDGVWIVGWLPKTDPSGRLTGGVGLSKNWRGFALDQV